MPLHRGDARARRADDSTRGSAGRARLDERESHEREQESDAQRAGERGGLECRKADSAAEAAADAAAVA